MRRHHSFDVFVEPLEQELGQIWFSSCEGVQRVTTVVGRESGERSILTESSKREQTMWSGKIADKRN